MSWFAQAPANIALIKYMGKKDASLNLPDNPSLSWTLNNLLTTVTLEEQSGQHDTWEPLQTPETTPLSLSLAAQQRFLAHLQRIKTYFDYHGAFLVRSANNFPQGSGLASSASSFAALTRCAVKAICELKQVPIPSIVSQAQLSRLGSGSSCRSFFSPWALWDNDDVQAIDLPYQDLIHQVVIISDKEKKISSSEAHQRIKTSPFYADRGQKASEHLRLLLQALTNQDWATSRHICWQEFQDMHQLFSSCANPFSYMTKESKALLDVLQTSWQKHQDGPLVTMDAGPNIHLLYRANQAEMAQHFQQTTLTGYYHVL